ncbi:MAG: hypothetical protein KF684_01175 [Phycisphaeraceae bacterium]|nr:hypothetical protein [Phycisphaeraceae bacterium]
MRRPTIHTRTIPRRTLLHGALCLALTAGASGQVELRGGAWVDEVVVEVSPAGVRVARDDASTRVLGWHEVKRVGGDFEGAAQDYRSLSDDAWRGWQRLQRGDIELAEPIFERLWKAAIDADAADDADAVVRLDGPTGLVIAEGTARVRLMRSALPAAVEPWATSVALRRSIAGDAASAIALLDPQLPPVFVHSLAVERLATTEPNSVIAGDPVASALFDVYRWAAEASFARGQTAPDIGDVGANPEVRFALNLALAQHAEAAVARRAADALEPNLRADAGSWREAWARYAIGASRLGADDERTRLLGVVHLLHLPARFSQTQRYLTGLALARSSVEFRRRGEDTRAAALRTELERTMPTHPAIVWMDRAGAEVAP